MAVIKTNTTVTAIFVKDGLIVFFFSQSIIVYDQVSSFGHEMEVMMINNILFGMKKRA